MAGRVGLVCAALLTSVGGVVLTSPGSAFAAQSAPSWEPDSDAAPPQGNLVFYDANGNVVTSGTNLSQPWAYAAATTPITSTGATKATLFYHIPGSNGSSVPGNWTGVQQTPSTTFSPSPTGTPPDLAILESQTTPYAVNNSTGASISTYIGSITPPTGQYANITQVRLIESGFGGHGNQPAGTYWESDVAYNTGSSAIVVDGTTVPANGWAELFPFNIPTTTTLQATPASPQPSGTSVTLKATVSPAVAGTVQFYDGTTALGSPVAVSAGTASFASSTFAVGSHSFTAVFNPTAGDEINANTATASTYAGSTSAAVPYTISSGSSVTVKTASPKALGQGATKAKVTITGTGFVTGATVTSSTSGVTFASVTIVSSTKLTALATVTATAATGATTLTVTDSSGSGSCSTCLKIDAGPTITKVAPATLAPGSSQTVTFTGTNFVATPTLKATGTAITITNVVFVSSTSVTATFTVSSTATAGKSTITLTNPDKGTAKHSISIS